VNTPETSEGFADSVLRGVLSAKALLSVTKSKTVINRVKFLRVLIYILL
jgi:hypothetical protein